MNHFDEAFRYIFYGAFYIQIFVFLEFTIEANYSQLFVLNMESVFTYSYNQSSVMGIIFLSYILFEKINPCFLIIFLH